MPAPPFVLDRLDAIREAGLFRIPPVVETQDGVRGRIEGRDVLLCCSNDYLGLRMDPRVREAAADAATRWGGGSGSSRMIAGSLPIHELLEEAIADWMGTEAALVLPSGYQANLALVQGLTGPEDRVYSDALNHASLIDGCRLSRAWVRVQPHRDIGSLRDRLALDAGQSGQGFVVGEGLYSMDGDRGPIAGWLEAASAAGAHVLVDEAHAVGVLGPEGRGAAAEAGLASSPSLLARVGTFGKALGAHGAFVATDRDTRTLLVNRGRTHIFTTGLAPAAAGAALRGIEIARSEEGDRLRETLRARVGRFRTGLADLGLAPPPTPQTAQVPIVPLVVGSAEAAMRLYADLLDKGVYAMAIRPPTVPAGTCRIRFTLSAAHTDAQVDRVLEALEGSTTAS